ncbi:MAG: hypothetical protein A4E64_01291 [Syntrophorhabdus sp. PtaU1.Bin058]|nr:MAG: hypothetical protein A4E64_01291 [Syntrophorhabdus sp. PtaU1.Bin058]
MILRNLLYILLLMVLYGCSTAPYNHTRVQVAPEPKNYAWWLRTEFIPVDKEIRGIPVEQIDASWRLASELIIDDIPEELRCEDGCNLMEDSGLSFSRSGDFNRDGIVDLALIGIYEDKALNRGSFLLILSKDGKGKWRKSFLERLGKPAFAALSEKDPMKIWYCMECDFGALLIWDKENNRYVLKPIELGEED